MTLLALHLIILAADESFCLKSCSVRADGVNVGMRVPGGDGVEVLQRVADLAVAAISLETAVAHAEVARHRDVEPGTLDPPIPEVFRCINVQ